MKVKKTNRYTYDTVPNDQLEVKAYTLENGLKLFLSVNKNQARVHTNIAFRAGSKMDPADTTGLAHYMEHMLFKGTSRIGALDWAREKEYLERIADLYEQHRATKDEAERREIYRQIDKLSFEAAKLVAPNEYDKLVASLGAAGTNAYTWVEQTVYVNEIPANELGRWMELESERFRMMALRLFHTELETVYEEFNINQDRDFRKVNNAIRQELFPTHPYGTQTTIGAPEHLRNPSMVNIQQFFETYYVPNNMAIILAGDFDPDEAVDFAKEHFGHFEARPVPPFEYEEQAPLKARKQVEVFGEEAPYLQLAWRVGGGRTDDPLMITLLRHLLYNEQAGLLDIELNQEQRVLESEAWSWTYEDYSVFGLYGKAREGQSIQEVEQLLLEALDKIKRGEIDDWLLEAVINDMKVEDLESGESNQARVNAMTTMFILGLDWSRFVDRIDWMSSVSKAEIADWARTHLRDDNYVAVYKQQGKDQHVIKVEKPPITPVELKRGSLSEYGRQFLSKSAPHLKPEFLNFNTQIRSAPLSKGLRLDYVHNSDNSLFRLDYIFEMGKTSDRHLPIALLYLPYLGTRRYSAAQLQQEFFRLGLTFDVHSGQERCYITLQGLDENLEAGIRLFEHVLSDLQGNERALQNVISDILTKRAHAKHNRNFILRRAMTSYATFGEHSPFSYRLSEQELRGLQPAELIERIRGLCSYEHQIYYYGPHELGQVALLLDQLHQTPDRLKPVLPAETFVEQETDHNKLLLLDFPIIQTDVMMVSKGTPHFNLEEYLMRDLYNDYFGYGLSSIVFQEIRESRALAYSTYAFYTNPNRHDRAHYLRAYVGTQPDKLSIAVPALTQIIEEMPVIDDQIEQARQSILRKIETERITPKRLYWAARGLKDVGYDYDLRRDLYRRLKEDGRQGLIDFHRQYIKGRNFTFLLLGNKKNIDRGFLESFGTVSEVTMEEVFGY